MSETGTVPVCAQCGQIIWPSQGPPKAFLWYEGAKDDDPLDPELARGAITHAECADDFASTLEGQH